MPPPHQTVLAALLALLGCGDRHADAPWRRRLAAMLSMHGGRAAAGRPPARAIDVALSAPWTVLPRLVAELAASDEEAATMAAWCADGVLRATGHSAPASGDLAAATAALLVRLWQIATGAPVDAGHAAAVRAQVAAVLDDPKVRHMPAEDLQVCWELCVGLEAVFAGFRAAASAGATAVSLQSAAHAALAGLLHAPGDAFALGEGGFHRVAASGDGVAGPESRRAGGDAVRDQTFV